MSRVAQRLSTFCCSCLGLLGASILPPCLQMAVGMATKHFRDLALTTCMAAAAQSASARQARAHSQDRGRTWHHGRTPGQSDPGQVDIRQHQSMQSASPARDPLTVACLLLGMVQPICCCMLVLKYLSQFTLQSGLPLNVLRLGVQNRCAAAD